MYTASPKNPSPETILETRRSRVVESERRDFNLFGGWGPRITR